MADRIALDYQDFIERRTCSIIEHVWTNERMFYDWYRGGYFMLVRCRRCGERDMLRTMIEC